MVWWVLLGAAASAPIWIGLALWASRRTWRSARRLSRRAKGQSHLAELGHIAGGLAHEIKNPLSTINLNIKLLSEDIARQDDELHQRWLRRLTSVQSEARRLKDILDDFLRYAGRFELSLSQVDLRQLIGELADFFAPQADASRVVMRLSLPPREAPARVDANLIKQALLNLMVNAVQAMPSGGELLVKLESRRSGPVIEVIDTGSGIAPDHLPRVFDVYYSTKRGGSGLGLPTTRRIIREHGGDVRVQSEVGRGTRFVISLPATAPATAENAT
jgi:signal transduction histidine kinase